MGKEWVVTLTQENRNSGSMLTSPFWENVKKLGLTI